MNRNLWDLFRRRWRPHHSVRVGDWERAYHGSIQGWDVGVSEDRARQLVQHYRRVDTASGIINAIGAAGQSAPLLSGFAEGWSAVGKIRPSIWTQIPKPARLIKDPLRRSEVPALHGADDRGIELLPRKRPTKTFDLRPHHWARKTAIPGATKVSGAATPKPATPYELGGERQAPPEPRRRKKFSQAGYPLVGSSKTRAFRNTFVDATPTNPVKGKPTYRLGPGPAPKTDAAMDLEIQNELARPLKTKAARTHTFIDPFPSNKKTKTQRTALASKIKPSGSKTGIDPLPIEREPPIDTEKAGRRFGSPRAARYGSGHHEWKMATIPLSQTPDAASPPSMQTPAQQPQKTQGNILATDFESDFGKKIRDALGDVGSEQTPHRPPDLYYTSIGRVF